MPVQSSYIWNHGVKMWIYGYAKYKKSLIVEGVSERWWRCCQTSFSLLLFLPNKNWRRGGWGYTSLWTLMDQVFVELPKVQDWVRCRPPSVAHHQPHWSQFPPRLMLLDLAVLPRRGLYGFRTGAGMGFVETQILTEKRGEGENTSKKRSYIKVKYFSL